MSVTPRRRIVRPTPSIVTRPRPDPRIQKLRARLEVERAALARWMTRLRRAFHSVERIQRRLVRLERQIARLDS